MKRFSKVQLVVLAVLALIMALSVGTAFASTTTILQGTVIEAGTIPNTNPLWSCSLGSTQYVLDDAGDSIYADFNVSSYNLDSGDSVDGMIEGAAGSWSRGNGAFRGKIAFYRNGVKYAEVTEDGMDFGGTACPSLPYISNGLWDNVVPLDNGNSPDMIRLIATLHGGQNPALLRALHLQIRQDVN